MEMTFWRTLTILVIMMLASDPPHFPKIPPEATDPPWEPTGSHVALARQLARLEQEYLRVLHRQGDLAALLECETLSHCCSQLDSDPTQALLMTHIKGSHAMTPRHGINVMILVRCWVRAAHRIGSALEPLTRAALIHDLGHWRPEDLVYVSGRFSPSQMHKMQQHARVDRWGADLSDRIQLWIRQHHERKDGKGYPDGIGDPHPLSQILSIAECYEGLTTARSFRPGHTPPAALRLMQRWAGYRWDPGLFASFLCFLGPYPPGSWIQLSPGDEAVVIEPVSSMTCRILRNPTASEACVQTLDLDPGRPLRDGALARLRLPAAWQGLRPDRYVPNPFAADPQGSETINGRS